MKLKHYESTNQTLIIVEIDHADIREMGARGDPAQVATGRWAAAILRDSTAGPSVRAAALSKLLQILEDLK